MQLYHPDTLEQIQWHENRAAKDAQQIWSKVMQKGARHYIRNVDCAVKLLSDKQAVYLPVVIPNPTYNNSYVCSPYGQYINYGYREVDIELGERPLAAQVSKGAIKLFEQCAPRRYFDKVVFVNNWLLSTNLYTPISPLQTKAITDLLVEQFPERAIVFRSLGDVLNKQMQANLRSVGYESVLSRQIYLLDPKKELYKKRKAYKEDLRLKRKRSDYQWVAAKDCDASIWKVAKRFYDDLYINKYSAINPQFTNAFFRDSIQNGWLRYYFLQKEGKTHAFFGYLHRQGVMTTPVLGYDFSLPQKEGMYRLTSLRIFQEGIQRGFIVNNSSGASKFKKLRGSEPSYEYNMIYTKHLSKPRQFPWQLLQGLTKHIASPILEHYEL